MKHKKLVITILIFILIATVLAMFGDQAIGSCCGGETANIEIWWWVIILVEIVLLVHVAKKPKR